MVLKKEWDSSFFSKEIGKIEVDENFEEQTFYKEALKYDLVYVFSKKDITIKARLVDVKMTFTKTILHSESNTDLVKEFDPKADDFNELLPLVYLSGHESRFFLDSFFGEIDFKKLYDKWISNSLQSNDSHVLIHKIDGCIAGFVSYKSEQGFSKIELIAVNSKYQGQGIGKLLLKAVENRLALNSILNVSTQEANISACFFYKKIGFKLLNKQYIYHYEPNTFQ